MTTRATQFDFLISGLFSGGAPLALGSVEFYEVGTTTPKNVWTEVAKTNAYTSYPLDANGQAELFGDGNYKIVAKDSAGSTVNTFDVIFVGSNQFIVRQVIASSEPVTPDDDMILCDSGSNDITLNFEDVTTFTRPVYVKKISANNTVTIDPFSTQLIDGAATYSLTENNETVLVVPYATGSVWRKASDQAVGLIGLTASIAEINLACDGVTASAAEINTACDGITATASELNQLDGNTVGGTSAGDIVTIDAAQTLTNKSITSPTISGTGSIQGASLDINGVGDISDTLTLSKSGGTALSVTGAAIDVVGTINGDALDIDGAVDFSSTLDIGASTTRRVTPGGTAVNNANGNCNISDTTFEVVAALAANTWESVGPTGAGADNTWAALDSIPADAGWVRIRYIATATDTDAGGSYSGYARKNGGSQAKGTDNQVLFDARASGITSGASGSFTVGVNSRVFDFLYELGGSASPFTIYLVLESWGFNP